MKAIEYLKQNAFNIASFFGFSGAALFALLGEGASMAAEYPTPAAALAVAALCLGVCIGNAVAKRRALKELQAERGRLEAENSSLNAAHAEQLAAMRAEFDSRLTSLRAEYDASAKEAAASKAKAAKLDKIQRRLSVLSAPQKELVAKVLDEGTIHEPSFGCDAAYLRDLGVFVTGSMVGMLSGADYSVNPEFAAEIREHRREWLGM